MSDIYNTEPLSIDDVQPIAGVDEVGRGPLVGDVVAAAVILDPQCPIEGLADSKRLSEKRRALLYDIVMRDALSVGVGRASSEEIDQMNILQASLLAMQRAVEHLDVLPGTVLVDGNRLPSWSYRSRAIVKGDQQVPEISAASIVAKVTRDREMCLLAEVHPEYGFERHKGYPTREHMAALGRYGALRQHRRSFAPVREVLRAEKVPSEILS